MSKTKPTITAQFGGRLLEDNRLYQSTRWSDVTGARADWQTEPSNKAPSVGRAFLGLIAGGAVGALVGFLIFGGVITVAVCAVVIGLVMGLTPTEQAHCTVTVIYPNGAVTSMQETADRWEHARYMAQEINRASAHYAAAGSVEEDSES